MSKISSLKEENAVGSILNWPERLIKPPASVSLMKNEIDVFETDMRSWTRWVAYYKNSLRLKLWTTAVRNIMDMNAFFGGFAAALSADTLFQHISFLRLVQFMIEA